jgi:VWFA-related protein
MAHSSGNVGLSILLCAALLACALPAVTAQQEPANPPAQVAPKSAVSSSPEETNLRTLDLIALDIDGRPVTDLRIEELRLFEGKAEQKIKGLAPAAREPLTIGLFFDVSGSRRADMYANDETRLTSELVHSVWHEGVTAFLVGFGPRVIVVTQPTQKPEEIDEGLELVPGGYWGPTALYDALCVLEPKKLASLPGRKVYVVLSDFEDNASRNKAEHVLEVAHQAGVSIFPVLLSEGFGGGGSKRIEKNGRQQALHFADETGGEVLIPTSGKQLPATFAHLASDLQAAYHLTYAPSAPAPAVVKKGEKILLQTTRPHLKLIYPKA